jgi:hypothetical protein
MTDGSQPPTKASMPQAALSSETVPALYEVSAYALHSSCHAIANTVKIVTEGVTTADMPVEPETLHSPEQNCPFFKLSTELRIEICRFAIQHTLDLVSPPSNNSYKCSAILTTRGALALLYTLRAESIDATKPLANAAKSSLEFEIDIARCRANAAMESSGDFYSKVMTYTSLDRVSMRLESSMAELDEVCFVLACAREADEKMSAGGEMGRAQSGSQHERSDRVDTNNDQWIMWSSA